MKRRNSGFIPLALIIASSLTHIQIANSSSISFTVYNDPRQRCDLGKSCRKYKIEDDSCINLYRQVLLTGISSINTHDNCVMFWSATDCSREFQVVAPNTHLHDNLRMLKPTMVEESSPWNMTRSFIADSVLCSI
jgi:hypothetical protein